MSPRPTKRAKTPTLLQMEAVECGAAALGIILAYYGKFVPLEELRAACGVSRDGSRANHMVRAARSYGLEARGFRKEIEDLEQMPMPVIVFWTFNHFLVVEGFAKDKVYLNDPAFGPRSVSREEFDASYTGVVLTFKPTEAFRKGGERPGLARLLGRRLEGVHVAISFTVLAGLALVIPGLAVPIFSKVFVDQYLVAGMESWVRPLLLGMLATAVIRGVLVWLQEYHLSRMQVQLALSSSSRFLWHIMRLPLDFFGQRSAGDIAARSQINTYLAELMSGELASTILNIVTVIFFAALLFSYDVVLTLIGIAMATMNLAAVRWVARRRVDENRRLVIEQGKVLGTAMNGLSIIETIKATASEPDFFTRWAGQHARFLESQQKLSVSSQYLAVLPPLLSTLTTTLILAVGAFKVMAGEFTLGMLIAYQSLMGSFMKPAGDLVGLANRLQEVQGNVDRVDDVMRYPTRIGEGIEGFADDVTPDPTIPSKLEGHLELRDVTFGYSRLEPPLLEGFSLTLAPGRSVALVGGSGSGKSTVARLVMGLYEPWSGEILFDGWDRHQLPVSVLASSVAMVDQDIVMFRDSIRDNLTLWDHTIPESEIIAAAKDACIHDVVSERPGAYDELLQEGGRNMSGGQIQRLEIARGLVANPNLLILDEATSALDPETERLVIDNIKRRGCSCLVVAHRLSTIRDCDEIIVLEKGKIVERGSHEELLRLGGTYRHLVEA